jgi:hypothetical protein
MFDFFRKKAAPPPPANAPCTQPDLTARELDKKDVVEAFDVIRKLASLEALAQALSRYPILRHPTFHAILNANLHAEDMSAENRAVIERFFLLLATRIHFDYCEHPEPSSAAPARGQRYLPYYFQAILHHIGARTPGSDSYFLDPAQDSDRIRDEVSVLAGGDVTLPEYKPLPGTRWTLMNVVCAGCRRMRVETVANMIDLGIAKQLVEVLRVGRLNDLRCPECGQIRCYPVRVWIQERPNGPDALAALTSVVRPKEDSFVATTPPGTPREPRNDKLHEIRSMAMFRAFPWKFSGGASEISTRFSIAYDRDQLLRYLN